ALAREIGAHLVRRGIEVGAEGEGPHQHKGLHTTWPSGGEQDAHGAALREAEEHGPLRADGIHDGLDLLGALLQRAWPRYGTRESGASLVEQDQARERGESIKPGLAHRARPPEH